MAWKSGDRLAVRGSDWRVIQSTAYPNCEALDLADARSHTTLTILLPFDRPRPSSPPGLQVVSRRRWACELSAALAAIHPYGGLNFCPSSIQLLPYQLEPALAVLRHGAVRVLIADDVGLGKTIEAGLIVRELAMRDRFSRTLIVCPASVREQWRDELLRLFALAVVDADAAWLRQRATELPPDVNPWSLPGVYLASLDFIKRAEALHPIEDVRWDLLVVDEAHAATPGSHRRAAVQALAGRSRVLVLLTATPHSGEDGQFAALCATGADFGSSPIVLFNRTRAETPLGRFPARSRLLAVRQTPAERRMHRLLDEYTRRIWTVSRARAEPHGELVAIVLRKRALSSGASAAVSLRRRADILSRTGPRAAQLMLPLEDDLLEADLAPDMSLGCTPLHADEDESQILALALEASEAAAVDDSKLRALARLLRRIREPALVFTEYRDTAEYLASALLARGHRVCVLHGGLSAADRSAVIAVFRAGAHVLIATDAASEGLNLHTACRVVVHFELPWMPLRLHQRRGRVDRIGQTRRVHEIALVANDTCEQMVLGPLIQRALRSRHFSESPLLNLPEWRVAAYVLGDAPLDVTAMEAGRPHVALQPCNLAQEALAEAERLQQLRRMQPHRQTAATPRQRGRLVIAIARARKRRGVFDGDLMLVVRVSLRDPNGDVVGQYPLAISVRHARTRWAIGNAALRQQVARVVGELRPHLDRIVEAEFGRLFATVGSLRVAATRAISRRDAHLQQRLRSTAATLVQPGLFDRRALRASAAGTRSRAIILEELERRAIPSVADDRSLERTCDVVAVLVGGRT